MNRNYKYIFLLIVIFSYCTKNGDIINKEYDFYSEQFEVFAETDISKRNAENIRKDLLKIVNDKNKMIT